MRAFTLLETVLYLGLFSIIMTSLFTSSTVLTDTATNVRIQTSALQETIFEQDTADRGVHLIVQ